MCSTGDTILIEMLNQVSVTGSSNRVQEEVHVTTNWKSEEMIQNTLPSHGIFRISRFLSCNMLLVMRFHDYGPPSGLKLAQNDQILIFFLQFLKISSANNENRGLRLLSKSCISPVSGLLIRTCVVKVNFLGIFDCIHYRNIVLHRYQENALPLSIQLCHILKDRGNQHRHTTQNKIMR